MSYATKFFAFTLCAFMIVMQNANAWVLRGGILAETEEEFHTKVRDNTTIIERFKIFPGTRWCGDGDIAENYDELGYLAELDKCCRTHDHCNETMIASERKHGLKNTGWYTSLHCPCDLAFYDCLIDNGCKTSSGIGYAYFNYISNECFDYKHPATCAESKSILGFAKRCVEYKYDESKPKEWQWFHLPRWNKMFEN